jgi:hypothetical protein
MRYLVVAAVLAAASAFGQQSDSASGVLVPVAPPAFHQAIRNMLGAVPQPQIVPQQPAPRPFVFVAGHPLKVCAIPLRPVPLRSHIDDRAFLKDGNAPVDSGIFRPPPAPACR